MMPREDAHRASEDAGREVVHIAAVLDQEPHHFDIRVSGCQAHS